MKNDLNKFFEFNLKCSDLQNMKINNLYAVFQIKDKTGFIELPGKILEQQSNRLLINFMNDGIDNSSSYSEWIPFELIRGIQIFNVYDRNKLLNTFKENKKYIITNLNDDKIEIEYIAGDLISIQFYCKNNYNYNKECLTSYPILLIKDVEEISNYSI